MIIVDTALQKRHDQGQPVRVAMIGAGFMAKGITNQIVNSVKGMRIVAIANRTLDRARQCYAQAGVESVRVVDTTAQLEDAIARGEYAITENADLLCEAGNIDCLIEATGAIEFGAHITMHAIRHGKHMVLMNAELDGTVGPILKAYADKAGVILTGCDGDQPGVEMNLYRYVKGLGLTPLLCGNIKGLQDPYRTPTTQKGFAERWGQNAWMVTSFADGTKISFEQAIVANATGMRVAQRGMLGGNHDGHVDDLRLKYDIDMLRAHGGIVEYVVGAKPAPGVFVLSTLDDPKQKHFLNYYKMGEGPLYNFYTPYHLCHLEVPTSVARVVLFHDAVLQPTAGPMVDVVATAKRDLQAGEVLDALGGYMTYGQCENGDVTLAESLLPIGLAEGCTLRRDVPKDRALRYADVDLPADRLADRLRAEQNAHFAAQLKPAAVV